MQLHDYTKEWVDTPEYHKGINEKFIELVNQNEHLKAHRDWVEQNVFGFGERSFHWLWKIIVDEMPSSFTFLEIGVFRFQVVSLIKMLSSMSGRSVTRYGISPLDESDGHWTSNYELDGQIIHDHFSIPKDYQIFKGLSTDSLIQIATKDLELDILYIDGGHSREVIYNDLSVYPRLVKRGGYLIIDDCCNNMKMPHGYFQGIQSVTDAVLEWEKTQTDFEFVMNVIHNKVYRRK